MLTVLLLEIVSIGLIFGRLTSAGVILLSVSVLYGVYVILNQKKSVKAENQKYIFTNNAIMNENLSRIIDHGIISGEFFLSNKIISDKRNGAGDLSANNILFENLSSLKRKGKILYVNSGNGISEILSYAYKNDCIVISSNENISKKILQMFSVKVIDIGFLKKRESDTYRKGDIISVNVTSKTEDGFWGTINRNERVFLHDMTLTENTVIEGEVEKVLDISGEKTIYAKKKY